MYSNTFVDVIPGPFSDSTVPEVARGVHCVLSANTRWLCALLVVLKSLSVLLDWSCVYIL